MRALHHLRLPDAAFARVRGLYLPRGRELAAACFSGLLVLGIGNGGLVFAEVIIPSGIAGLIVTMSPFWMVGAEALLPGGERLHAPTIAAMAVGLAGASLLFTPDLGTHAFDHNLLNGFLILQIGMAGWSFGSIYQRRKAGKAHPIVAGGVQQLAAGLMLLAVRARHSADSDPLENPRRHGAPLSGLSSDRWWATALMPTPWTGSR